MLILIEDFSDYSVKVSVEGWMILLLVMWSVMRSWRDTIVFWIMLSWVISIFLIMWVELFDIVPWPVVIFTVERHVNTVVVLVVCSNTMILISTMIVISIARPVWVVMKQLAWRWSRCGWLWCWCRSRRRWLRRGCGCRCRCWCWWLWRR